MLVMIIRPTKFSSLQCPEVAAWAIISQGANNSNKHPNMFWMKIANTFFKFIYLWSSTTFI